MLLGKENVEQDANNAVNKAVKLQQLLDKASSMRIKAHPDSREASPSRGTELIEAELHSKRI